LINTRKRKVEERRVSDEKEKTLRMMSEAAGAAVLGDFMVKEKQPPPPPPPRPPPPPPVGAKGLHFVPLSRGGVFSLPAAAAGTVTTQAALPAEGYAFGPNGEVAEEEDLGDGTYEVDGKWYLMGEHDSASTLLLPGALCQVLLSGDGLWCPAETTGAGSLTLVPNTSIRTRKYPVRLLDPAQGGGGGGSGELVLPASSLRLALTEAQRVRLKQAWMDAHGISATMEGNRGVGESTSVGEATEESDHPATLPAPIDENTGLGAWQTVAIKKEPEGEAAEVEGESRASKKSRRAHEELENTLAIHFSDPSKALDSLAARGRGAGRGATQQLDEEEEEDSGPSALHAFNPSGGTSIKAYRGFSLAPPPPPRTVSSLPPGAAQEGWGDTTHTAMKTQANDSGQPKTATLLPPTTVPQIISTASPQLSYLPQQHPPPPVVEFKVRKPTLGRVRQRDDD